MQSFLALAKATPTSLECIVLTPKQCTPKWKKPWLSPSNSLNASNDSIFHAQCFKHPSFELRFHYKVNQATAVPVYRTIPWKARCMKNVVSLLKLPKESFDFGQISMRLANHINAMLHGYLQQFLPFFILIFVSMKRQKTNIGHKITRFSPK